MKIKSIKMNKSYCEDTFTKNPNILFKDKEDIKQNGCFGRIDGVPVVMDDSVKTFEIVLNKEQ